MGHHPVEPPKMRRKAATGVHMAAPMVASIQGSEGRKKARTARDAEEGDNEGKREKGRKDVKRKAQHMMVEITKRRRETGRGRREEADGYERREELNNKCFIPNEDQTTGKVANNHRNPQYCKVQAMLRTVDAIPPRNSHCEDSWKRETT